MKTNREKNTKHDKDQILKVRPKGANYDFKPLQDVIRKWVTGSN